MSKPKLLLADDSITIRKVVELTFADEGIDVTSVADAQAAMEKFVEVQPDIVLLDVGLEGTSGYEICEMIKFDETTRQIPVLLLVGSFEPFDQAEAERVGANGYLTKPFHSIRELVAQVFALLNKEEIADGPMQPISYAVTEETSDIDDLYKNSFAATVQLEGYDTAEDVLGDSGMDDDMIEKSYPKIDLTEPVAEAAKDDSGPDTKEFDWSPESMVSEPGFAKPSFEPMGEITDYENFESLDTVVPNAPEPLQRVTDDQPVEQQTPVDPSYETTDEDLSVHLKDVEPEPNASESQVANGEIDEAASANAAELPPAAPTHTLNGVSEPSPEMIERIAKRVVERLSDNVIREIAQTAVPRIAEKLIREALEEEKQQ